MKHDLGTFPGSAMTRIIEYQQTTWRIWAFGSRCAPHRNLFHFRSAGRGDRAGCHLKGRFNDQTC